MTHPAGRLTGQPLLEQPAAAAIEAARQRAGLTRPGFPAPARHLTDDERQETLDQARKHTCRLCGGLHTAPNTPACPRVARFKMDGDGRVTEGEFWPDGSWDASRVLFVADAAEEPSNDQAEEPPTSA